MDAVEEFPTETPQTIQAEPAQNVAEPKASQGKRLFSGEFAREMARKSVEVREQRRKEAEQAKAIVGQLQAAAIVQPDDHYRLASLARTRGLIEKLELELEQCSVPQASHYLVSSIAKLRDAEQKLANRPLPGSRRPGRETPSKAPITFEPSE